MPRMCCAAVLCSIGSLLCLPVIAFAQALPPEQEHQIVKLPGPAPLEVGGSDAKAPLTEQASDTQGGSPAAEGVEIASLTWADNPTPYWLIEAALEYFWVEDLAAARDLLNRVIALYPGTPDADRASALFIYTLAWENRTDEVNQLTDQLLARAAAPETQALASLMRGVHIAIRTKDWDTGLALTTAAAAQWTGTPTGAWAAIALGDLYRDQVCDYAAAHNAYIAAARDYAGTQFAAEALVNLAECMNWYEHTYPEAKERYQQALELALTPRVEARALLGLADCTRETGEYVEACEMLTSFIERYPDSPLCAWARGYRADAELHLGWWDEAADDAGAALESSSSSTYWRYYEHVILGNYAFRNGQLDAAEGEFTAAVELPEQNHMKAQAYAGLANCRSARGDLRGAISAFLDAAGNAVPGDVQGKDLYLYGAAVAADQLGDRQALNQIVSQMVAECPGSSFTTRIVGGEVLPPAEP